MGNNTSRVRQSDPTKSPNRQVRTLADIRTVGDLTNAMLKGSDQPEAEPEAPADNIIVQTGVVMAEDGLLTIGGYKITSNGLLISDPTADDWDKIGLLLFRLEGAIQMLIGDWLAEGERVWGVTYSQVAANLRRESSTLYNYKYVAQSVPFSLRSENLTYSHYQLVAGIEDYQQKAELLEKAAKEKWTVGKLRTVVYGKPDRASLVMRVSSLVAKNRQKYEQLSRQIGKASDDEKLQIASLIDQHLEELEKLKRLL